jgi:hypothetical protein
VLSKSKFQSFDMKRICTESNWPHTILALAASLLSNLIISRSGAQGFADSFEAGYSQNWVATSAGSGSISLSGSYVRTGTKAVSTYQNGGGNAILVHTFPSGFKGKLSVWHFISSSSNIGALLNAWDSSGRNYSVESINANVNQAAVSGQAHGGGTEIDYDVLWWVGPGWHHLEIEVSNAGTHGWYDGAPLPHTHPTLTSCSTIQFGEGWTSYGTIYWDDFEAIEQGGTTPFIAFTPATLDFSDTLTQRTFDVWNSGGGTLNYTLTGWPNWVSSVSPTSGSSTGTGNKVRHTVQIDRSKLPPGPTTRQLTITAPGAANNPQTVQLSAMNPVITGTISFSNRLGTASAPQAKIPTEVWVSVWADLPDANYQWPAQQVINPIRVDNAAQSPQIPYSIPSSVLTGNSNYTLEVNVYPGLHDAKRIRFHLPDSKVANGVSVVLTHEDVVSHAWIHNYRAGPKITYHFSDWTADTATLGRAEQEKSAVTNALNIWASTRLVGFKRVADNAPADVTFSKTKPRSQMRDQLLADTDTILNNVEFAVFAQPDKPWSTNSHLVYDSGFCKWGVSEGSDYSLTSATLHEVGHCLGLCYAPERDILHPLGREDYYIDTSPGGQWSIMTYKSMGFVNWLGWSDVEAVTNLKKATKITAACPVDLIVTDPNGLTTSRTNAAIPASQYYESDGEGGTNHIAVVVIEEPVGTNYQVAVVPRPEAQTNSTFSLSVQSGNGEVPLTVALPLTANPTNGFTVYAQPGLVQFDHCVFSEPLDQGEVWVLNGTTLPISFSVADCTNAPISEIKDLLMEIIGPDVGGSLYTNVFSLTNSTLHCDTSGNFPVCSAAFDTVTNSVKVDGQYSLAVKQYGAPIGTATLVISTNRDSRVNIREYDMAGGGGMSLRWGAFPGQVFVESSTNLATWETVAGPLSTNRWTSGTPTTEPCRFYRTRGVPTP